MQIWKENDKFIESEEFKTSPEFHYFKRWLESNYLPLPTINKINQGIFMLVGYKLNSGLCSGLQSGLEKLKHKIIKIVLENNGISDEMLSQLIKAFTLRASDIKSICISQNEFGPKSSANLWEFLEKAYNLEELKIDNCKIIGTAMDDLIDNLKNSCSLKILKLSQAGINTLWVRGIWKILAEDSNLHELDISWNNILPTYLNDILEELDANRSLRYLNLSWNQFKGLNEELNKQITTRMCNFINENKWLIHLDLCSINLQGNSFKKIGKMISMSSSLQGFHLSGNPMTPKQIRYLRKWLRISQEENKEEMKDQEFLPQYGNNIKWDHHEGDVNISQKVSSLINGLKTKHVKRDMKLKEQSKYSNSVFSNKYIVTRNLGHPELPQNSESWKEVDECWICEKYAYYIVFYNKTIRDANFNHWI